jgi:isochorismate synthase
MNAESFLKEELKKIDSKVSQTHSSFIFNEFSLVDLLPFAATEEVFYFESKEEDFTVLGLGKSRDFTTLEANDFIENNPEEVLVYQDTFEQYLTPECYLPEWSFIKRNGKISLHIHQSKEFKSLSPSNLIFNLTVWESFVGPWISYEEQPESDEWESMIANCTRLFNKKTLEKIVLSRKKLFKYDQLIEMPVMFREIYNANLNSSHFSIYHQFNYQEAFLSFTPERLFTLKGNKLESISLAGSNPRGATPEEDQFLEENLASSDKLTREHEIVTKSIEAILSPILSDLQISKLFTMKLPYIQHRQAKITGTLKEETSPFELIKRLHPTPAVGGIPQEKAREKILEIEKIPRGYYAAAVGVVSKKFSEIAVGIRSGHILGQTLTVFGGAGIVAGSVASEEWSETGIKMQPFIKVINKSTI